jgi:hypothetical protein
MQELGELKEKKENASLIDTYLLYKKDVKLYPKCHTFTYVFNKGGNIL